MGRSTTDTPQMRASPELGGKKPVTMRMVVDLPAPFGPRKPSTSPFFTEKVRQSTAVFLPNRLVRFSTSIMMVSQERFRWTREMAAPVGLRLGKRHCPGAASEKRMDRMIARLNPEKGQLKASEESDSESCSNHLLVVGIVFHPACGASGIRRRPRSREICFSNRSPLPLDWESVFSRAANSTLHAGNSIKVVFEPEGDVAKWQSPDLLPFSGERLMNSTTLPI